ncbi:hypothetical protein GCM10027176_20200 [Actinoallomurus bryophytorum]|uniref:Uncharacterized protein n=1 Tax=Actinoallomurus bryophytorum TaxID=1490222 RepID=A0A543CKR6_9ACTN|nr:hypothetical protein [Actinoallomurus bryophytorum]TQL97704.1 hypothetical protein FB559_3305 [Actinoallomurus bryophytorum]
MIAGSVAFLLATGWSIIGLVIYGGEMVPNLIAELAGVSLEVAIVALIVERLMARHQRWQWDFAYRALAKRASEVFVDVVRLVFVHSSNEALHANLPRYGYFVQLAQQHLDELRSHIEGSATALDSSTHEEYRRMERRFSWCIRQLLEASTDSNARVDLYPLLSKIATSVFELLTQVDGDHRRILSVAESCVATASSSQLAHVEQGGIFTNRLAAQSLLLEELGSEYGQISSIAQDVDCDYSIPYFMIDYLLLAREEGVLG